MEYSFLCPFDGEFARAGVMVGERMKWGLIDRNGKGLSNQYGTSAFTTAMDRFGFVAGSISTDWRSGRHTIRPTTEYGRF